VGQDGAVVAQRQTHRKVVHAVLDPLSGAAIGDRDRGDLVTAGQAAVDLVVADGAAPAPRAARIVEGQVKDAEAGWGGAGSHGTRAAPATPHLAGERHQPVTSSSTRARRADGTGARPSTRAYSSA